MYIQTHGCKNAQLLHFLRKRFIHIIADKGEKEQPILDLNDLNCSVRRRGDQVLGSDLPQMAQRNKLRQRTGPEDWLRAGYRRGSGEQVTLLS